MKFGLILPIQSKEQSLDSLFEDLAAVHRNAGAPPMDVALGFYEAWRRRLFNSALYASLGGPDAGIRHVHRKVFPPRTASSTRSASSRRGATSARSPRRGGVRRSSSARTPGTQ